MVLLILAESPAFPCRGSKNKINKKIPITLFTSIFVFQTSYNGWSTIFLHFGSIKDGVCYATTVLSVCPTFSKDGDILKSVYLTWVSQFFLLHANLTPCCLLQ